MWFPAIPKKECMTIKAQLDAYDSTLRLIFFTFSDRYWVLSCCALYLCLWCCWLILSLSKFLSWWVVQWERNSWGYQRKAIGQKSYSTSPFYLMLMLSNSHNLVHHHLAMLVSNILTIVIKVISNFSTENERLVHFPVFRIIIVQLYLAQQ